MSAPEASRQRAGVRLRALCAALLIVVLAGCGSAPSPSPTPSATPPTPIPSTTAVPSTPAEGISLAVLGVRNGPAALTLPRGSVLSTVVDQPNNVVLVFSAPSPTELMDYLQRVLPTTGFVVTDPSASEETFTFRGDGWSGSFTSSGGSAALLLRPL